MVKSTGYTPTKMTPNQMYETQEIHCAGCGRFLGLQAVVWGVVRIKCPNCKEWNTIDIQPEKH